MLTLASCQADRERGMCSVFVITDYRNPLSRRCHLHAWSCAGPLAIGGELTLLPPVGCRADSLCCTDWVRVTLLYISLYAGSALQVVRRSTLLPVMTERVLGTKTGELWWLLAWQAHVHTPG